MKTADDGLLAMAAKVSALTKSDNAVDVLCEVALFEPDGECKAARANAAGTKVIYTYHNDSEATFWAPGWTVGISKRRETAQALRARYGDRGRGQ